MKKWTSLLSVFLFFLSAQLSAGAVEFIGSIPVVVTSTESNNLAPYKTEQHRVFVEDIRLSDSAQRALKERFDDPSLTHNDLLDLNALNLPARIDLGMNGTPVLDQGAHGSCVTFAITGALDALIAKGDYISQLCSLELGDYLKQKGKIRYSGWDGSTGPIVLNQLQEYGVVARRYQTEFGCAGVKRYPRSNEKNTGNPMSINEYSANALPLANFGRWESLIDINLAFTKNYNPTALLRDVKKHLREGNRITFGVLLDVDQGHVGALGTHKKNFDTWVLTPEIIRNAKTGKIRAGHQMIIIGYDDQALVPTQNGQTSKGVFILRNSWGKAVGGGGNYYMSYAYFKALCVEAQVIRPVH